MAQPASTPFDLHNSMPFSQEEYQQLLALICPQQKPHAAQNVNHQAADIISTSTVLPPF